MYLFLFTIGFLPAVLWLIYFLSRDRLNPEPPGLIIFTFALGMLAFWVATRLEISSFNLLYNLGFFKSEIPSVAKSLVENILIVGTIEELVKWLPPFLFAYFRPDFDEPLDGIIYCLASALGFAAVENIKYLENIGPQIILIRGSLTNLGHAFFAGISGYGLGRSKFTLKGKYHLLFGFLLLACLAHGLYDFIVDLIDIDWIRVVSLIGFISILGIINYKAFRKSEKDSPYNKKEKI